MKGQWTSIKRQSKSSRGQYQSKVRQQQQRKNNEPTFNINQKTITTSKNKQASRVRHDKSMKKSIQRQQQSMTSQ